MRFPWWRRGHREKDLENQVKLLTACLEATYGTREPETGSEPPVLLAAMREPRYSGEPVWLDVDGRRVLAVIGPEGADPAAIWRDITAAVVASEELQDGGDLQLVPPSPLAPGLRGVAVVDGSQLTIFPSSAVTAHQRAAAVRRAVAAARGHKLPVAVPLPLLMPWWRKAAAAAGAAATGAMLLIPAGQAFHLSPWPPAPRPHAGAAYRPVSHSAQGSSHHARRGGGTLAGGQSPSRLGGAGSSPPDPAPPPGRSPGPQPSRPQPSFTPVPRPTHTAAPAPSPSLPVPLPTPSLPVPLPTPSLPVPLPTHTRIPLPKLPVPVPVPTIHVKVHVTVPVPVPSPPPVLPVPRHACLKWQITVLGMKICVKEN